MKPCIVRVKPISLADVEEMLKSSERKEEEEQQPEGDESDEENRPPPSDQLQQSQATTTASDLDRYRLKRINTNSMLDLGESNFEISSTAVRNTSEYDEQIEIIDLTMDDEEAVVVNLPPSTGTRGGGGGGVRGPGTTSGFFDRWPKQRKDLTFAAIGSS